MKILFYDGNLIDFEVYPEIQAALPKDETIYYINGVSGPTDNTIRLDSLSRRGNVTIVTNSVIALSHRYGWNYHDQVTDIFLFNHITNKFTRADLLTDEPIKQTSNIAKMYLTGVFD